VAVAGLLVVVAAVFCGFIVIREVSAIRQGMAHDRAYEDLLQFAAYEQAIEFNLDDLRIPQDDIRFGGPPKDGIPAISEPEMVPAGEADHLLDDDRIVAVTVGDASAAYPIRALMFHEAVNDIVGGVPLAIVYCPLCDSVTVVDRRLDGTIREFGISGLLYNSNVLLFDRNDDSLWSQLGFEAISGPNAGRSLEHLPWELTSFARWRDANPTGRVMTFNTGHDRDYDKPPYGDYFMTDQLMFPVKAHDGRLGRKIPVVGVVYGDVARAYPVDAVRKQGSISDAMGDARVVLRADGDVGVRVIETPPGAQVAHTFWFSWAAFHPGTEIYGIE
jgi:hypothetical protein